MASIKILLRNKPNKEGQYPVVLKIIKERQIKVITLGISCLKKDWDAANSQFKKSEKNHIQRNRVLLKKKEEALKIIDNFYLDEIDFTLNQFEEKFRGRKSSKITVSQFWLEKIDDFNTAGRTSNAKVYKDVYNSFYKFSKNKSLVFREITPNSLDKYETFLRGNNNSNGGIGIKMRTIRALYNYAIKSGIVDVKYYPFNDFKISKFKAKGIKKALRREDMRLMENVDTTKYPHLTNTRNYLVFSYYMGGMNFIDIMKLKWSNIEGEVIHYTRSKTKGRFKVKMLEPVKQIINYYKNQNRASDYVFPILLKDELTPMQIENRKHKTLRRYNKQLKEIAKIQGLSENVTSYVIRHSFATNLKFAGISSDLIGQSMGHTDVSITNSYLKEFDDEVIDNAMKKLLEEPQFQYAS
ncbi:integrase [Flavobacterium sp. 316]|uniref:site-specific integrase n=1 Tax=Flavobacterium sp. 316 TaxID=1603293 RepID=UPI0005E34503|nr:site-specific integrase [Flavobacterium sp. 316]KIX20717.1 integrase [Flavobacterium sp. 316]